MRIALALSFSIGLAAPLLAHAEAPTVTRVTEAMLAQRFPGAKAADLRRRAAAAQWRPSTKWLATEGKKYGVVLAVSDTHPGPGVNPDTGKLNNAEDFKAKQESDFHLMLQHEWVGAKADGQTRTLLLNGDTLEFMQTSTPPDGTRFRGHDEYGAVNTPRNIRTKLQTIFDGHPKLFLAYGEHMANGHRILLMPGNHDRQLTEPAVRASLRKVLIDATAMHLLGVQDLDRAPAAERTAAIAKARAIVKAKLEIAPPLFMHGDVLFAHGNQTDPANTFTTLLGNWYGNAMRSRDSLIQAAWGDYFVKSSFNQIEQNIPWGDNDMSRVKLVFKSVMKERGLIRASLHTMKAMKYTWTREGHGSVAEEAALEAQGRADIARFVKDSGFTAKVNELREGQPQLGEAEVVQAVADYHAQRAKPVLMMFPKEAGAFRRMLVGIKNARALVKAFDSKTVAANEENALKVLFTRLGIKTYVTGHDHVFRDERYVIEGKDGPRLGRLVDTATWTDGVEQVGGVEERRGVARISFDAQGSRTELYNYDPTRGYLAAQPAASSKEGLKDMARAAGK